MRLRVLPCLDPNQHGRVHIVADEQWGDNGKGKIVDVLTERLGISHVVRPHGGPNAAHTIYTEADGQKVKLVLRGVPSCVARKGSHPYIGRGSVVNPGMLIEEISSLRAKGFVFNLSVDERAHVIMPYHRALDDVNGKIGSTRQGIGMCYSDKALRIGIRMMDLINPGLLQTMVMEAVKYHNAHLRELSQLCPEEKEKLGLRDEYFCNTKTMEMDANPIVDDYLKLGEQLTLYIVNTGELLIDALEKGHDVLAELAHGAELSIDGEDYPFCTSSNTTPAVFGVGTGVPNYYIDKVYGLIKAYATRVGNGPMIAELNNEIGERLRRVGKEKGSGSGRDRRCAWLNLYAARNAMRTGGITHFFLMKIDVLSGLTEINVCRGYKFNGEEINHLPRLDRRENVEPIYKTFEGWRKNIVGVRKLSDLPRNAREYINWIQKYVDKPLAGISTGPHPEDMIWME